MFELLERAVFTIVCALMLRIYLLPFLCTIGVVLFLINNDISNFFPVWPHHHYVETIAVIK